MLEKTEGPIKKICNPEKRATLGTQNTGRKQTKQKTHHYVQVNINSVNKTWDLIHTAEGKGKQNIAIVKVK